VNRLDAGDKPDADTASLRHAQHRIVMRPVTTMRSIHLS
jgi:hypothetical protein